MAPPPNKRQAKRISVSPTPTPTPPTKRVATSTSVSSSGALRPPSSLRVTSAASKASAEKAAKLAAAVQVPIQFGAVEKYQCGLKILLPETIYGSESDVSCKFFCFCLFIILFLFDFYFWIPIFSP